MRDPRDVVKRPVITEETTDLMADKKYVFEVDTRSNKTEIRQAVEQIFEVKVVKVNTINVPRKPKTFGRYTGKTAAKKKAVVQLSADSKPLEFFEGV